MLGSLHGKRGRLAKRSGKRGTHNERGVLCTILCTLLLFVVCYSLVAESYYSIELLDEQACLYKDTKIKIENKKLENKTKRVYVDLCSLHKVKDNIIPTDLIYLHGLASFDRHANIGCFNKFIIRKLAVYKWCHFVLMGQGTDSEATHCNLSA